MLTQGTGGVSIFAVQFAKAAGATVIATTSSTEKAEVLKKLGADHVINYKDTPEWGEKAAYLTPHSAGVDHVLEVGGPVTMAQSLKAVKIDGVISIIGFLGGNAKDQPSFLDALNNICTVRGLLVGSRQQFEDMNRAIDANKIKPVVDDKVFGLEELKEYVTPLNDGSGLSTKAKFVIGRISICGTRSTLVSLLSRSSREWMHRIGYAVRYNWAVSLSFFNTIPFFTQSASIFTSSMIFKLVPFLNSEVSITNST